MGTLADIGRSNLGQSFSTIHGLVQNRRQRALVGRTLAIQERRQGILDDQAAKRLDISEREIKLKEDEQAARHRPMSVNQFINSRAEHPGMRKDIATAFSGRYTDAAGNNTNPTLINEFQKNELVANKPFWQQKKIGYWRQSEADALFVQKNWNDSTPEIKKQVAAKLNGLNQIQGVVIKKQEDVQPFLDSAHSRLTKMDAVFEKEKVAAKAQAQKITEQKKSDIIQARQIAVAKEKETLKGEAGRRQIASPNFRNGIIKTLKAFHGREWDFVEPNEKKLQIRQEAHRQITGVYPGAFFDDGPKGLGWYVDDRLVRAWSD